MNLTSRITDRRKARFCEAQTIGLDSSLVFVDVGSGGPLKHPWTLLPAAKVDKVDFDPEVESGAHKLPLCISNQSRECSFYIARDPRSSSLHQANPEFVSRFGQESLLPARQIVVRCVTLDDYLAGAGRGREVDAIDINTEGHDFQVLQGSERTFVAGLIKLVKVEFELAGVWQGQGWFSDIDVWMRDHGYELVDLELGRIRHVAMRAVFSPGEPVWGKAVYVPGLARWRARADAATTEVFRDDVRKAAMLWTAFDAPGRVVELARWLDPAISLLDAAGAEQELRRVFRFAPLEAVQGRVAHLCNAFLRRLTKKL